MGLGRVVHDVMSEALGYAERGRTALRGGEQRAVQAVAGVERPDSGHQDNHQRKGAARCRRWQDALPGLPDLTISHRRCRRSTKVFKSRLARIYGDWRQSFATAFANGFVQLKGR